MDRLVQRNVLAMSGRAVEAAGDVNTLLLDKTGTITLGNRQAERSSLPWSERGPAADAAQLSSLADETPRAGRSSSSPRTTSGCARPDTGELTNAEWVEFTATTRMSG